ncbi:DsbA family protein [Agaricicola taiwanensis]|nr:DsbA family protein [Agaricicola taiwanensis]
MVSLAAIAIVGVAAWAVATGQMEVTFPKAQQAMESPQEPGQLSAVVAAPEGAPSPQPAPIDRTAVETIVREYMLANPELLRDMAGALQAKEQAAQQERAKVAMADLKPKIFSSPLQMELGNPEGDVTLVEFFDYNCGFCRQALSDLNTLIEQDPKLKVVLKEFPVLGEESVQAARVAIAVHRSAPEKYAEFHRALLGSEGQANGEAALKIAEGLGLNAQDLIADADSAETEAYIRESHQLAQALGISGTPSYIVGEDILPGAIGVKALKQAVDNVRSCGKATCS